VHSRRPLRLIHTGRTLSLRAAILLLFCIVASGFGVGLHEVRIRNDGTLIAYVVDVNKYRLVIDEQGIITAIELNGIDTLGQSRYLLGKERIMKTPSDPAEVTFADGRLSAIGSVDFRYHQFQRDKIVSIDSLDFEYQRAYGKLDRIWKIGCTEIVYRTGTNQIESIGRTLLRYAPQTARIEDMVPFQKPCTPRVKVICAITSFK